MRVRSFGAVLLLVVGLGSAQSAQAACTKTGFVKYGINLTSALINPVKEVSGDVDATGCNIGIYYGPGSHGRVSSANVHGARHFGIVNNGGNVEIGASTISDIGDRPLSGNQYGIAVYFAFGSLSQGKINGNTIWNYQASGIVVNGSKDDVDVAHNLVLGQGAVDFQAQNGIQIGFGARAHVHENFVSGNSYSGAGLTAGAGVLVIGGDCFSGSLTTNTFVEKNQLVGNDVGVWLSNLDAGCNPSSVPTRNVVADNDITDNAVNNTTGGGPTQGYQAGIADQGNGDVIKGNDVCGNGYTGGISPAAALYGIDVTATNHPVVSNNTTCHAPASGKGPGQG